ncbi:MAG TPA: peptidoglycan DD-metalloendopeptidase family protein [Casimicrobiaceae bacterium]|nr:peptidoglycan DD-metalloendopeptidase family protein [Casimicrobiaceae bacterium]
MPSLSSLSLTHSLRFFVVLLAVALVAAGCATHRPAPVEDRTLGHAEVPRGGSASSAPQGAATEGGIAQTYTVKRGDTLHQIALDTGLDYRDLAAWNNIENVNRIYPGQVLRLTAPGTTANVATAPNQPPETTTSGVTTAPLRSPPPPVAEGRPTPSTAPQNTPPVVAAQPATPAPAPLPPGAISTLKTSPKAIKEPYSEQAVRELNLAASAAPAPPGAVAMPQPSSASPKQSPATQPRTPPSAPSASSNSPSASSNPSPNGSQSASDADALDWSWPAKGKVISGFSETANLKGIDIAGTAGEAVRASAAGRVVYAGTGLRGYGKLIIIKHNATYLSAYAHNRDILVKEGQQVTRGQKIAEMGSTDADRVMLHFEIRRHGKPMDPTKFLPPAT